jgi:hypothetical protein
VALRREGLGTGFGFESRFPDSQILNQGGFDEEGH